MNSNQPDQRSVKSESRSIYQLFRDRLPDRKLSPFLFSLVIHLIMVAVMACWVLPLLTHGTETVVIEAAFQTAAAQQNELQQFLEVSGAFVRNAAQPMASTLVDIPDTRSKTLAQPTPKNSILRPSGTLPSSFDALRNMPDADFLERLNIGVQALPIHAHRGESRVVEAGDSMQVASTLQGDLLSIAKEGDAMVVWLLDQSISMQQDTKTLAAALKHTLQQIQDDQSSKMQHAVVAFCDGAKTVKAPTANGLHVPNAIYNLPADPSGVERTFESVEWCVSRLFRHSRRTPRQRLLILWTDESGDDYQRLESTIAMCRQANVRVDVIGPSAVLGAQTGFTRFVHPADQYTYYLPVHRGPDSAFPQKLSLGYWYRDVPPNYNEAMRGPHQGTSPRWHGGSDFQAMLSGFSPYSLTRLAKETGGRYLMFDRPGDRPPFTLDHIQKYQPDYRSLVEIQADLGRHPLRQIILASTLRTWNNGRLSQTQPIMKFPPNFAGQSHNDYVRNKLVPALTTQVRKAFADAQAVENALQPFLVAKAMSGFVPQQDASDLNRKNGSNNRTRARASKRRPEPSKQGPSTNGDAAENDQIDASLISTKIKDHKVALSDLEKKINEDLLQQLYKNETSPRWRAWADLNMGRLLALSVRLREYLIVSNAILNNLQQLQADTNSVTLAPTTTLSGGAISQRRIAFARKLLERCVQENPGTPWQVMAARELKDPVGLKPIEAHIRQRIVAPRPTLTPIFGTAPVRVRPKLPNL